MDKPSNFDDQSILKTQPVMIQTHLGDVLEEDSVEGAEVSAQVGLLGRRRGQQLWDPALIVAAGWAGIINYRLIMG